MSHVDHATLAEYAADIAYERFRLWQLIHRLKTRQYPKSDFADFTPFDQALETATKIADLSHKIQAGIPAAVEAEVAKRVSEQ